MADLAQRLKETADKGTIHCAGALNIAREFNVSPRDVGETLDTLKIKIVECQLGCFGTGDKKTHC